MLGNSSLLTRILQHSTQAVQYMFALSIENSQEDTFGSHRTDSLEHTFVHKHMKAHGHYLLPVLEHLLTSLSMVDSESFQVHQGGVSCMAYNFHPHLENPIHASVKWCRMVLHLCAGGCWFLGSL